MEFKDLAKVQAREAKKEEATKAEEMKAEDQDK
jgi:hypothetical protein